MADFPATKSEFTKTPIFHSGEIVTYTQLNDIGYFKQLRDTDLYRKIIGDRQGVIDGFLLAASNYLMSAVVGEGRAIIEDTNTVYATLHSTIASSETDTTLTFEASDLVHPRIDVVSVDVTEEFDSNVLKTFRDTNGILYTDLVAPFATSTALFKVTKGVANATPSVPVAVGVPLYYVYIPALITKLSDATIHDVRPMLLANGSIPNVRLLAVTGSTSTLAWEPGYTYGNIPFEVSEITVSSPGKYYFDLYTPKDYSVLQAYYDFLFCSARGTLVLTDATEELNDIRVVKEGTSSNGTGIYTGMDVNRFNILCLNAANGLPVAFNGTPVINIEISMPKNSSSEW